MYNNPKSLQHPPPQLNGYCEHSPPLWDKIYQVSLDIHEHQQSKPTRCHRLLFDMCMYLFIEWLMYDIPDKVSQHDDLVNCNLCLRGVWLVWI